MKIYNYDDNGYYTGSEEARLDPLDKKPLIPAKSTTIEPPKVKKDHVARFIDGQWAEVQSPEYSRSLLQEKDERGIKKYKKGPDGQSVKRTVEEIKADEDVYNSPAKIIKRFNEDIAFSRMAQVFSPDRLVSLSQFGFTIHSFMRAKNFDGLNIFINSLIQSGKASSDDLQKFKDILSEQGIQI